MLTPGEYQTVGGFEARVFAADGAHPFPLLGAVRSPGADGWLVESWTADGNVSAAPHADDVFDLKEKVCRASAG